MDWVGIRDGNGWEFELVAVGGADECCAYCHSDADECNAWLYAPSKGPGPDCTVIVGYEAEDAGGRCPSGRPEIMFNEVDGEDGGLAGRGPCSGGE